VLSAIISKAPQAVFSDPLELMNGLLPMLTTNLTRNELMSLSVQAVSAFGYDIVQGSIPMEGTYSNASIRGMAVLEVDFEKNKEYIRTEIYGK